MGVAIVTDGAASLPAERAAEFGITVVPMWLELEGREVRESDCPLDDVLRAEHVTTSGPSPGDFDQAIGSPAR